MDRVRNSNAQVAGAPVEVTDPKIADQIRTVMKERISDTEIQVMKSDNKNLAEMTNDQIRDLATSGKVKAYLSFEPDAECFNLGFMIEPGSKTIE